MRIKSISVIILMILLFAVSSVQADGPAAKKLTIENNSRMDMIELYPSNLDTGTWGHDLLKGKTLGYGDRTEAGVDPRMKMLDLRAVFANGTERTYYGIDVKKFSRVRLNTMDMEPYE